ncbi:MAG: DUF4340 domain-containing protein [candidate division Zixibacteria bacterium]|nr:DUF4340 domain-containing protein [candidate division Zixibacteria bacterium]
MSGWRNTAILGALLAILAGYFYFFEADKQTEEEIVNVFDFKTENVTRVKVTSEGVTTAMENTPTQGWQIVEPITYPADPEGLSKLLSEIAGLTFARTVADSVTRFADYGLDPPQAAIEISVGLSAPHTLLLGDANPTASSFYAAAKGGGKVFLISNETNSTLRKNTSELRDRRLVHAKEDKVDEFIVRTRTRTINGKLDSLGTWRIYEPFRLPAERNEAVSLVGNILGMMALEYVDDHPTSLAPYGLDAPVATAMIRSRDGSVNATVSLGKTEDDRMYALSSERPTVYKISSHFLAQIDRDPELFRRKTAFDFRSYEIPKMYLQLGPEKVSVVKRSFDDWRIMEPFQYRADDKTITAILDSLEVMKIGEYIPSTPENLRRYGFEKPAVQFSLSVEQRSIPQEILVGGLSQDGQFRYIRDPKENWIYAVGATAFSSLPPTALDLRDRKVLRFKGFEVHMFEVVEGNRRTRVRRDQKEKTVWKLEAPIQGNADAVSVGRAFGLLDTLFVEAFITDDPQANLAPYGLEKPFMEVILQIGGRDNVPEERLSLLVGRPFPGDGRLIYIKRRDSAAVALTKSDFLAHLKIMIANTAAL